MNACFLSHSVLASFEREEGGMVDQTKKHKKQNATTTLTKNSNSNSNSNNNNNNNNNNTTKKAKMQKHQQSAKSWDSQSRVPTVLFFSLSSKMVGNLSGQQKKPGELHLLAQWRAAVRELGNISPPHLAAV